MPAHNLYLPADLSARAKAAELNLSALLRAAVARELDGDGDVRARVERRGGTVIVTVEFPASALDGLPDPGRMGH